MCAISVYTYMCHTYIHLDFLKGRLRCTHKKGQIILYTVPVQATIVPGTASWQKEICSVAIWLKPLDIVSLESFFPIDYSFFKASMRHVLNHLSNNLIIHQFVTKSTRLFPSQASTVALVHIPPPPPWSSYLRCSKPHDPPTPTPHPARLKGVASY